MYAYPRAQDLPYPARVLSNEGPLSRSDPSADRARAGRTGAPRNGRRPGGHGGALGGAAPSLGRARCLAARGGYVNPASKGCLTQHPWRLPPLHPLARFARDWQTSDALRRENAEAWLFEIRIGQNEAHGRATLTAVIARLDRATQYSGPPEIHTNAGDYWFPAFAGMTNLYARPSHLSSAQERQPLEQMHVLLVLEQRAMQRRDQFSRVALAQHFRRHVLVEQQF